MTTSVIIRKFDSMSEVVVALTRALLRRLGPNLIKVESVDSEECNVRVVLRRKEPGDVDTVLEAVDEVEEEFGIHGAIMPEVVSSSEERVSADYGLKPLADEVLKSLERRLRKRLGPNLIKVESVDSEECNVRVVLRRKELREIDAVLEAVDEVEEEFGIHGAIMPEVVEGRANGSR